VLVVALVVVALCAAGPALALQPDELLLLANKNHEDSVALAKFYADARHVPEGRILAVDFGSRDPEQITFDEYETAVVPAVRAFLRGRGLQDKVKCVVTFYGAPLRISGKKTTDAERAEIASIRQQLEAARKELPPIVGALEALASEVNPKFVAEPGDALDQLGRRADAALRTVAMGLRGLPQAQQVPALVQLGKIVLDFTGPTKLSEMFQGGLPPGLDPPGNDPKWRDSADHDRARVEALQERRFDPVAREELRTVMRGGFGAFGLAHLLQAQIDYLDNDGTAAAFDSELALLWWTYYPRSKWHVNPLHYRAKGMRTHPVLMTMRLDAPTADLVRTMITDSIQAETDGLKGKFVIDSRGIKLKAGDGYGVYDQTLRNLRNIVADKTKMQVIFDDRPEVLAPKSVDDVALYCGWYSLRKYVAACDFNPGAVAFHVASLELVRLHVENEGGWVFGLLRDGVAATLGAVAEPYLHAFPPADEFFPLLLTGELPLAEVYWRTTPVTSWMINMIGDPLYRPFKTKPQMKPADLPPRLKDALEPMPRIVLPATRPTRPTTAPTSAPTTRP
jgi:uncharacterized protein (TIGR03790 family)